MFFRLFAVLSVALMGFLAAPANAMSVTPIVFQLKSLGADSSATITSTNTGAKSRPVDLTVSRIEIDETGKTVSSVSADDDFIVLPPQAIIPAGGQQAFRFQFIGAPDIARGRLYRFTIDEVPIVRQDDGQMKAQLNIVYSVAGLISVAPVDGSVVPVVEEAQIVTGEGGEPKASVRLRNDGTEHLYLSKGSLSLRQRASDGRVLWGENLNSTRIERELGFGIVPPGQSRVFLLPYDLPSAEGILTADFSIDSR